MPKILSSQKLIENKIFFIRGQRVLLDKDLAELYAVETKRLNEQVKRNKRRFPKDFMFRLTMEEKDSLRSQFATLEKGAHSKYLPYAFTEQGVAMLSSVLNSERAIEVNVSIMRAFVRLREMIFAHKELAEKFKDLEQRVGMHDKEIKVIFEAIRQLMTPPDKPQHRMGFHP